MDESEQNMTRYLLGELSESEQSALEEKFFADPQVFDQVLKAESELLDNYVRGRLSPQLRARFERSYLPDPRRRERVKFAEALAARLDQAQASRTGAGQKADQQKAYRDSLWQRLLVTLRGQRLAFSLATVLVLLITIGGLWSLIESRRLRREAAQAEAARVEQERRAHELEQQQREAAAAEPKQTETTTAELNPQQNTQPQTTQPSPIPTARDVAPALTFVTLHLPVGVTRSADMGSAQTLTIPPGTKEVRLRLDLKENDYASYGVTLQAVGGSEIFGRQGLKPAVSKSGARLLLTVPASSLANGDYMLTLRGAGPDGSAEELSKSLFRIEKR